jgi:glycosyltransferase involved in cell wall biosynthesis
MITENKIEKQDGNKLNPLVSIVIITYNSSKYVLDTLESAKAQTYQNIELIVSDDCSTDDTVEICKSWIEANKDCFARSEVICVEKNTGIPANCNRGIKDAKGEWVKCIAGDDILEKECIASFMNFCSSEPKARLVESISQFFNDDFLSENFTSTQNFGDKPFFHLNATATQQYQILLRQNFIHGPSVFMHRETLNSVGGYDESNRYMEDHPLFLKMTKQGHKVFFLNKVTVYYRIHNSSVYGSFSKKKLFNDFYQKRRSSDLIYIYPNINL